MHNLNEGSRHQLYHDSLGVFLFVFVVVVVVLCLCFILLLLLLFFPLYFYERGSCVVSKWLKNVFVVIFIMF